MFYRIVKFQYFCIFQGQSEVLNSFYKTIGELNYSKQIMVYKYHTVLSQ